MLEEEVVEIGVEDNMEESLMIADRDVKDKYPFHSHSHYCTLTATTTHTLKSI